MKNKKLLVSTLLGVFMSSGLVAQTDSTTVDDFFDMDMSLEDLMGMEITSASKKAERLQDVSSAIYVINQNDIARSSATRIVELLQQVPGFWLVDNSYTSTEANARGATGGFVGTMLVLIDGVPAQNPFTSQMDYSTLDLPLNEIERIEVIRGPGGTIYGANAATGVVNIFTKGALGRNETYSAVEYGDNNYINVQTGISKNINEKTGLSVYGKARLYDGHEPLDAFEGDNPTVPFALGDSDEKSGDSTIVNQINGDVWKSETFTIGGKLNHEFSENTKLSVSGQYNMLRENGFAVSNSGYIPNVDFGDTSFVTGINKHRTTLNAKLDHSFNENHSIFLNASYSGQAGDNFINGGYKQRMDLIDFEVQDNFTYKFNNFAIGGNVRNVTFNATEIFNKRSINYKDPVNNNKMLFGGFVQDKMSFFKGKLDVTLGIKGEVWQLVSNDMYFSPSAKFAYKPNEKHTIWGSASRAVTTPGFIHTNIALEIINFGSRASWTPVAIFGTAQQLLANNQASDMQDALAKATQAVQNDPTIVDQVFSGALGQPASAMGRSLKITSGENTKPSIYDWFELGYRTSAINKVSLEVNAFLNFSKDLIDAQSTPTGTFIEDPTSPGDSIQPFYYTNLLNGSSFGGEFTIKAMPYKFLNLEASYALLRSQTTNISDDAVQANFNDITATPMHTIRFKAYIDLPKQVAINITGDWADNFSAGDSYDYVNQRWPSISTGSPFDYRLNEFNKNRVRLNAKITKKFMDGKMNVYLWGNDLLEDGTAVRVLQFSQSIPFQTQRMYGLGLIANF